MAVFAVGDVQGCYDELRALLDGIGFCDSDTLWLTGDLVNRGPKSLEVLRFVRDLGPRAVTVLGNHDLHLLAHAEGHSTLHPDDTMQQVTAAPDARALLHWLRRQPLLHHDASLGFTMIHAGLPPQWDLATAKACAAEVEAALRGDGYRDYLANMYGNQPRCWSPELTGWDRLRFITNCFTRLRYCHPDGRLALKYKGTPEGQNHDAVPWFEVPQRRSRGHHVVFGHWSTLTTGSREDVHALDGGCVWGGQLTAVRLDGEMTWFHHPCAGACVPG